MQLGIEGIADLTERLDLELLKAPCELLTDHLNALFELLRHFLALKLGERLGHAVRKRKQLLDRVGGRVVVGLRLFVGGTLAVIIVLGVKADVLFLLRFQLFFELLRFGGFLLRLSFLSCPGGFRLGFLSLYGLLRFGSGLLFLLLFHG